MIKRFTIDIPAGPIWNNDDARKKCPIVCAAHMGEWNGQWKTVVEGEIGVCGCTFTLNASTSSEFTIDVIAGPLRNDDDAREKCPIVCTSYGGEWNGQWKTIVQGKMSVCGCKFKI